MAAGDGEGETPVASGGGGSATSGIAGGATGSVSVSMSVDSPLLLASSLSSSSYG